MKRICALSKQFIVARWRRIGIIAAALSAFMMVCTLANGQAKPQKKVSAETIKAFKDYQTVVERTAKMVGDDNVKRLAAKYGLQAMNITWEDTGRFQNSAVGPNISDMTIQVQQRDPRTGKYSLTCMPVIRFPNFTDKTGDIDPAKFYLPVGNEKDQQLKKVNLLHFLANIRNYLHDPNSWKSDDTFLHANRDTHVLVSAQACFLPIPKKGEAEFNPVLFNYQSIKEDPAVLTILVTREGTSVTVIDNVRDRFDLQDNLWGQRLFFNKNGERCSLTGKRLSDFVAGGGKVDPNGHKIEAAGQKGLNMVMLIQVPLKQRNPMRFGGFGGLPGGALESAVCAPMAKSDPRSDVEAAVIGHGKVEGKFTEIDNLPIERDHRFPVRVTVQFYKATSNGVVSEKDMREMAEQINKVYKQADYVGSLVVDGTTGRPTEYDGNKVMPPDWWAKFWKRYEQNTGYTRQQAINYLRKHHGHNWRPVTEKQVVEELRRLPASDAFQVEASAGFSLPPAWPVAAFAGCIVIGGSLICLRLKKNPQAV